MKEFDGTESSSFQKRPAYRYIRATDQLPTYDELGDLPIGEIKAKVKLFNPTGRGTWYIAAYDPDTRVAWGAACIHEHEVGSIGMAEVVDHRGRFGLPIERDLHWSPRPLSEVAGS